MNGKPLDVLRCDLSGTSLIEASAGTGKTWNICVLYLRLLLQRRLDVSQILVVTCGGGRTFRNPATHRLRDGGRLSSECVGNCRGRPGISTARCLGQRGIFRSQSRYFILTDGGRERGPSHGSNTRREGGGNDGSDQVVHGEKRKEFARDRAR